MKLSSVGASEVLRRYEIPVVIDSPGVGENLQDHSFSHVSFEVADGQVSGDVLRDPNVLQGLIKLYQETHGGPLSGMPISIAYLPLVDGAGRVEGSELRKLVEGCPDGNDKSLSPARSKQYEIIKKMLLDPHASSAEYLFLPLQMHANPVRRRSLKFFRRIPQEILSASLHSTTTLFLEVQCISNQPALTRSPITTLNSFRTRSTSKYSPDTLST